MKAYERRAIGKTSFYKLSQWNDYFKFWKVTNRQFDTESQAKSAAKEKGLYRVSFCQDNQPKQDFDPFEVPA